MSLCEGNFWRDVVLSTCVNGLCHVTQMGNLDGVWIGFIVSPCM